MIKNPKIPIALMIGHGSRIPALLKHLDKEGAMAKVVMVVSHKALGLDEYGEKTLDVVGIAEAKKRGITTAYFNLVQMRALARKVNPGLDDDDFRQEYFRILGAYLNQSYPQRPEAVFMLGWDLVVPEEFLKYFPGPVEGVYNVFNLHPAQLGEKPGDNSVKLSSGEEIPVLRGEHDQVITEAIRLGLPALGACIHFARPIADEGGYIIKRAEVPILKGDSLESYERRLLPAEEDLVIDVVDLFANGKIRIKNESK